MFVLKVWVDQIGYAETLSAAALGFGNGGVFELVPQYFPKDTATFTGLVGVFRRAGRILSATGPLGYFAMQREIIRGDSCFWLSSR